MTGVGKTQIAKEFVYLNKTEFDYIFWITATDYEQLVFEYRTCLSFFDINIASNANDTLVIEEFKAFCEGKNLLLIIDNANTIKLNILKNCLPNNVKILITLQNSNVSDITFEIIKIDTFSDVDAINYLTKYTPNRIISPNDNEDAKLLVHILGNLPIAIECASTYIDKRKISIASYIEKFNKLKTEIFNLELDDYQSSYHTAFKLCFNSVKDKYKRIKEFMFRIAFMNFSLIQLDYIFIENQIFTIIEIENYINELISYSLIEIIQDYEIKMHPLTQEFVLSAAKENDSHDLILHEQVNDIILKLPNTPTFTSIEDKNNSQKLLPHSLIIFKHFLYSNADSKEILKAISRLSLNLYNFGSYTETKNQIIDVVNKGNIIDSDIKLSLTLKNRLYLSMHFLGETTYALVQIKQVTDKIDITNSELYPELSYLFNSQSLMLKELSRYSEAFCYYLKALRLTKLTNNIEQKCQILMNIGIIHKNHTRNYVKALNAYKYAFNNCENSLLKLRIKSNIAAIYKEQCNYNEALELLKTLEKEYEKLGNNRDLTITYDYLGNCYMSKDCWNFKESLSYYEKSLKLSTKIGFLQGIAYTNNNLGELYKIIGQIEKSKEHFVIALEMGEYLKSPKIIEYVQEQLYKLNN